MFGCYKRPQVSESPGVEDTGNCELCDMGAGNLNSGPLQEQYCAPSNSLVLKLTYSFTIFYVYVYAMCVWMHVEAR